MTPRQFALVSGIVFFVMGLLAFVPGFSTNQTPLLALNFDFSYGLFIGLFAMNVLNKLALIVFGIAGIALYVSGPGSQRHAIVYSRWVFAVMGLLSILGMFPQTQTLFGIWPLYGNEVWAHGLFSLLGAYFGYGWAENKVTTRSRGEMPRELRGMHQF